VIILRPVTELDIPLLNAWDEEPAVVASDPMDDWDWHEILATEGLLNYIAELDGRPIGCVQITDLLRDASHYWGEPQEGLMAIDITIGAQADRGKGHGGVMMRLAHDMCFADPNVQAILIDPLVTNTRAIQFYQRLGYRFIENRWFDDDYCAVHQLNRTDFEKGPSS
jgi:aminoglycoside 6'-N-acetyltransferase